MDIEHRETIVLREYGFFFSQLMYSTWRKLKVNCSLEARMEEVFFSRATINHDYAIWRSVFVSVLTMDF